MTATIPSAPDDQWGDRDYWPDAVELILVGLLMITVVFGYALLAGLFW